MEHLPNSHVYDNKELDMSKLIVFLNLTLEGVLQGPGRPDEDTRGGFKYSGWAAPYSDPSMGKTVGESMATTGGIILGRRTYKDFYKVWPKQKNNPFTDMLNNTPKYVASKTLKEPLPWMNSVLLKGDAPKAIAKLKAKSEKDFVVLGSGLLVHSLMKAGVIDRYILLIHPLVLGSGKKLFSNGTAFTRLKMTDTERTKTGVVVNTYDVDGSAK
jgi:dihydrofolate reductase